MDVNALILGGEAAGKTTLTEQLKQLANSLDAEEGAAPELLRPGFADVAPTTGQECEDVIFSATAMSFCANELPPLWHLRDDLLFVDCPHNPRGLNGLPAAPQDVFNPRSLEEVFTLHQDANFLNTELIGELLGGGDVPLEQEKATDGGESPLPQDPSAFVNDGLSPRRRPSTVLGAPVKLSPSGKKNNNKESGGLNQSSSATFGAGGGNRSYSSFPPREDTATSTSSGQQNNNNNGTVDHEHSNIAWAERMEIASVEHHFRLGCSRPPTDPNSAPTARFRAQDPLFRAKRPLSITMKEIGGRMMPVWHQFLKPSSGHNALVYVIDCANPYLLASTGIQLLRMLKGAAPSAQAASGKQDEPKKDQKPQENNSGVIKDWPILVLLNKIRAPGALNPVHVCELLGLDLLLTDASVDLDVTVLPCDTWTGEGMIDVVRWFESVSLQTRQKRPCRADRLVTEKEMKKRQQHEEIQQQQQRALNRSASSSALTRSASLRQQQSGVQRSQSPPSRQASTVRPSSAGPRRTNSQGSSSNLNSPKKPSTTNTSSSAAARTNNENDQEHHHPQRRRSSSGVEHPTFVDRASAATPSPPQQQQNQNAGYDRDGGTAAAGEKKKRSLRRPQ